jgi:hypothetical protein
MKNKKSEKEEISATALLQKIKSNEINPKTLSSEERQACINLLVIGEGFTYAQTAQLLCCSEKTIQRDIAEIRRRNSLNPSLELAKQLIGEMIVRAETHIAYLMRLSRSREGSIGERAQTEFFAWKITVDSMTKLQSFGYLPLIAQHFEGDLFHHLDGAAEEKSLSELRNALSVIEITAKEEGTLDKETEEKIKFIESKIVKAEIESAVDDLSKQRNNELKGGHNEERKDQ